MGTRVIFPFKDGNDTGDKIKGKLRWMPHSLVSILFLTATFLSFH